MRKILMVAMLATCGATIPLAHAGKLQCWVDDKGVRACGDRVPPQYAKQERKVLNEHGVVVGTKAREKTQEEVAEAQRQAAAVAAEKKRYEEQVAYDKYMLQTFESVTQMQGVRDTRLATLDGRLKLAERSVTDAENSLKGLRERLAALEKEGKTDVRLKKQVTDFEASLVDTLRSVAQMKKEREEISLKFSADAERFKQLRAGQVQMGSPAAGPAPAAAPAP